MDFTTVVAGVLTLAGEQGVFSADLAATEERLVEFLRGLGQAVQQQHVNAQSGLGYEASSRRCPCGQEQKFIGYRPRTVQTLLGSLELPRAYYHCRHCHTGCVPYDQAQGLGARGVSVPLAKRVVELTQDVPFGKAQRKLLSLLGCGLSENTLRRITQEVGQRADELEQQAATQVQQDRQSLPQLEQGRLYVEADGAMVHFTNGWHEVKNLVCRWQDAKEQWHQRVLCRREKVEAFTAMAWATAHACGLENARQSVLLGDGIAWIWNHLGPIADEAVQILDWYHATEHLWADGPSPARRRHRRLQGLLHHPGNLVVGVQNRGVVRDAGAISQAPAQPGQACGGPGPDPLSPIAPPADRLPGVSRAGAVHRLGSGGGHGQEPCACPDENRRPTLEPARRPEHAEPTPRLRQRTA